jgi:hypothetical protein
MPWLTTEAWVGEVATDGMLGNARRVAGGPDEALLQPEWSPDGDLYLVSAGLAPPKARPSPRFANSEYLGAPVATSLYAAGFCAQYPLYLGISGGLGSDLTVDTLAESDAMIVVGASLNEWTTHFGKILENGKKIIQIDDRQDAFGWFARIAVGLEADAKVAVAALLDRLKEGGKPRPSAGCGDRPVEQQAGSETTTSTLSITSDRWSRAPLSRPGFGNRTIWRGSLDEGA